MDPAVQVHPDGDVADKPPLLMEGVGSSAPEEPRADGPPRGEAGQTRPPTCQGAGSRAETLRSDF